MGKKVTLKENNRARSESTSKSPAPSNRLTNKTTQISLKNLSSFQDSVSKKSLIKKKMSFKSRDEDGSIIDVDDLTDGENEEMVPVESKKTTNA